MTSKFDFSGKCVVVTGGNRGIGEAISEKAAASGARVAIIYRSSKDAPEVAAKLAKKYNTTVEAFQCDVSEQAQVTKTFHEIDGKMGPVTGVVANAGVSVVKESPELTKEDFDKVFGINVWGQFNCCMAAVNLFKTKGYKNGSVVVTSSMSSRIQNRGIHQVFYNTSKAASSNMVRQLAVEFAEIPIRFNALSPGYVATDQTQGMAKDLLKFQNSLVPLNRFSQPEEQAGMAIFLLSDAATYCTGQDYFVDGGAQAW